MTLVSKCEPAVDFWVHSVGTTPDNKHSTQILKREPLQSLCHAAQCRHISEENKVAGLKKIAFIQGSVN